MEQRLSVGQRAWRGDPAAPWRSQCSLAISVDGDDWALLNAAPDLRQQILATAALHPRVRHPKITPRHSPIRAVVLTNGDVDHVAGLLCLRESQRFDLFASGAILEVLAQNPIFNVLNPSYVTRHPLTLEQAVEVLPGLSVMPFAVPGKVALYLEDETPEVGAESEATIGLELHDRRGARVCFVPGCARVTPALAARLDGADLVFFDGTLWTDDEMILSRTGVKTGARMGHISISGRDGSLAALEGLALGRRIYLHINNTNPILLEDSPERARVTAAGWEVARDGMEIEL